MSASFPVGERVWANFAGQWWPARVVLGAIYGIAHNEDEIVVKYYSADADASDFDVLTENKLAYYEESSEKAATLDAALLGAMEACKNDDSARPLRDAVLPAGSSKRHREGDAAHGGSSKHHRKENLSAAAHATTTTSSAAYSTNASAAAAKPSSSTAVGITRLQNDLQRATEQNDVIAARRCLLKLANQKMSFELLLETKVGIAVANLLGLEHFRALHPLAKAIVCDWAGKLPQETIRAIKHEIAIEESLMK